MTSLEGGVGALAFATGMAATHCVTMLCQSGDKIVAGADIYGGTYRLFHKIVKQAGVSTTLVDSSDLEKLSAAVTDDTRIVWIESPGNPLLSITDIASVARIAHRHGAILAVDSTFATPALSRPLEHGADIVMHSATKFLGGHSDAMGGILVARVQDTLDQLYFRQNATGATLSSFDCFLISRGIKTLDLRIRAQSASALEISSRLAADSRVARVFYPGLPSHPGHELAAGQMDGAYGGVVSFEVAGDFACAKKVVDSTELFQLAVSLGAVESLIEQPAAMSHASYDAEDRALNGITDSLVRISVGLEDLEDLWDDLQQALSQ
jgi:cystathionine beta-lyase/cystathionine gamma-synthase